MTGATPSPAVRIRSLVRPLLARNPDLVLTGGKFLCLTPIGHVARQIRIYDRPSRGYFTLEWRLSELYIRGQKFAPPAYGRTTGLIGRSRRFRPRGADGLWEWDDPTMADDFIDQVEAEGLTVLRALDSFEKTTDFMLADPITGRAMHCDMIWMCMTSIALGKFDVAQKYWSLIVPSFADQFATNILTNPISPEYFGRQTDIKDALDREDPDRLAELLRENEKEEASYFKLERHWRPTPFPFENVA